MSFRLRPPFPELWRTRRRHKLYETDGVLVESGLVNYKTVIYKLQNCNYRRWMLTMKSPLGLSFDAESACIADWPRLSATLALFNESSDCSGRGL